jgi:hypothetical protein
MSIPTFAVMPLKPLLQSGITAKTKEHKQADGYTKGDSGGELAK